MALSEPTSPFTGPSDSVEQNGRIWQRLSKWLGRDESLNLSHESEGQMKPSLGRRLSRKVVPGLPRSPTFRRQNSEKRERLLPVNQSGDERRAQSLDRRRARSLLPFSSTSYDLASYPIPGTLEQAIPHQEQAPQPNEFHSMDSVQPQIRPMPPCTPPAEPDELSEHHLAPVPQDMPPRDLSEQIHQELEDRWILNLSMHFRDNSPREKFFVTFAETPTRWRRLTVSCDYRDAPPESLERDLQALTYQRDKNARIYEAIRNSLPDIQFYDTVTNLRLQTGSDDRLHVHVTEDVNEIIHYPSTLSVKHLEYARVDERDVAFDSHMSGFVYKVRVNNPAFDGKICVKKEIPGPDSVEEFLYEVNALNCLVGTSNVVQFEGLVIDEENDQVKGLLISYANQGPLVDLIYDFKGTGSLSWERKAKWARQMIYGLSAIHESGFVQGDCTLSNIVIDQYDDALIIDINRRGCPVGWEPPEIHNMIDNGHRISMYIGIKSDLFQLGMSLWAMITEEDEPERQTRPLTFSKFLEVPQDKKYLLEVTKICLSERPKDRLSAEKLLSFFPQERSPYSTPIRSEAIPEPDLAGSPTCRDTIYVDPSSGMEEDISNEHFRHLRRHSDSNHRLNTDSVTSEEDRRGRQPAEPVPTTVAEEIDLEPLIVSISPGREPRFSGNFYGIEIDENDDEEAVRRVIRRRQRMQQIANKSKDDTISEEFDILRGIGHTDSGIDSNMLIDTKDVDFYLRGLDHIDSGLADMDIGTMNSNDLARRKTDLKDLAEELDNASNHLANGDTDLYIQKKKKIAIGFHDTIEKPGSNAITNSDFKTEKNNIDSISRKEESITIFEGK